MGEPNRISVHHALGAGSVADVLLWKNWRGGVTVLVSATALWYLFERAGYNFLSFVANVVLLLVVILFLWAKAANLLNRPLPPLPDLEISEETIARVADSLQIWLNRVLSLAHDIAIKRNLLLCLQVPGDILSSHFCVIPSSMSLSVSTRYKYRLVFMLIVLYVNQVVGALWVISYIGSLFNFLTLIYIGVLLSLSLPVLYDKYQDQINDKLYLVHGIYLTQYKTIHRVVLSKIPKFTNKEKKVQ
ncbi:reticulon-like protein B11 isoform X1 [Lotus japonicus]|uniref:reticulon-like protein B11 isoform X1 n=1 Tax=Lotus japonicus TaxID=34305 RepID=UPI00258ADA86|nr:reticulon-like protein B11 isoform X1 [Lotus japonicus]